MERKHKQTLLVEATSGIKHPTTGKITLDIWNNGNENKIVALLPSVFNTIGINPKTGKITFTDASDIRKAGYKCDLVIDDNMADLEVVCRLSNPMVSIKAFINHIKRETLLCTGIVISADNLDVFEHAFEIVDYNPLAGNKTIRNELSSFMSVYQFDQYKIEIWGKSGFEVNGNTLLLFPVPAGRTISLSFRFQEKSNNHKTMLGQENYSLESDMLTGKDFLIRYQDKSYGVQMVQRGLNKWFGQQLKEDGFYGDKTKQALLDSNFTVDVDFTDYVKITNHQG